MDGVIYPGCRVLCVVAKQNKPVPAPFKMKKKKINFFVVVSSSFTSDYPKQVYFILA